MVMQYWLRAEVDNLDVIPTNVIITIDHDRLP